jgi:hypothetical protein
MTAIACVMAANAHAQSSDRPPCSSGRTTKDGLCLDGAAQPWTPPPVVAPSASGPAPLTGAALEEQTAGRYLAEGGALLIVLGAIGLSVETALWVSSNQSSCPNPHCEQAEFSFVSLFVNAALTGWAATDLLVGIPLVVDGALKLRHARQMSRIAVVPSVSSGRAALDLSIVF